MSIREGSIQAGTTSINYVSFGKGITPLVMIPGLSLQELSGSGAALNILYKDFTKDYRVYCIDRKKVVPQNYTIEQIADDTALVMKALGLHGAYVLGISQGGLVAQYLAIKYPELVGKLVIACSLSRPNDTLREKVEQWTLLARQEDFPALASAFLTEMYSPAYVRKYRLLFQVLIKKFAPGNLDRFITLIQASLTGDTYDQLDQIRCPAFVIGGALDQVVTREASEEMAQKLRCPIYLYKSLGHSAFQEAKDFNTRVLEFFSGKTL